MHPRAIAALFRHLSREICPGGCSSLNMPQQNYIFDNEAFRSALMSKFLYWDYTILYIKFQVFCIFSGALMIPLYSLL